MRSMRSRSRSKLQKSKSKRKINLHVACESCKHAIAARSPKIKHKQKFEVEDGRSIFVTYFDCPSCGSVNVCQVDDQDSLKLLDKVTKMLVSGQQSAELSKADEIMQFKRNNLMKRYHDEIVEMIENG